MARGLTRCCPVLIDVSYTPPPMLLLTSPNRKSSCSCKTLGSSSSILLGLDAQLVVTDDLFDGCCTYRLCLGGVLNEGEGTDGVSTWIGLRDDIEMNDRAVFAEHPENIFLGSMSGQVANEYDFNVSLRTRDIIVLDCSWCRSKVELDLLPASWALQATRAASIRAGLVLGR